GPRSMGGIARFLEHVRGAADRFAGQAVVALEQGLVPEDAPLPDTPLVPLHADPAAYDVAAVSAPAPAASGRVAYPPITSASTGDGRVVAVTHGCALTNLRAMADIISAGPDERGVSWLPLNHDFGLCTVLYSLLHGYRLVLMRPTEFVKRPGRWLAAISR